MHGRTLSLQPAAASAPPGWLLATPQEEGLVLFSFAAGSGGAPALCTAQLLLSRDAAIVAEVNASADEAQRSSTDDSAALAAAVSALGRALRFDGSGALCSAAVAAEGAAVCFAYGWRSGAARLLAALAQCTDAALPPLSSGGTLLHAAARCDAAPWAVPAVLAAGFHLGSPASRGGGALCGATPIHAAAVRGCAKSLAALTAGADGVAAFYAARDNSGSTPRGLLAVRAAGRLEAAALLQALEATLMPRARAGNAAFCAARELLTCSLGVALLQEQLAMGEEALHSSPVLAPLHRLAAPAALDTAAAFFRVHADNAALAADAAEAEAEKVYAGAAGLASDAAAQLVADRHMFDEQRVVANVPNVVLFLLHNVFYDWLLNRKRLVWDAQPLSAAEIEAIISAPGEVLPWKLTWRMYHSTYNWNGLPLTMCMLLLTVATYGAPRVRALYVRHNTVLLGSSWMALFVLNPLRAAHYYRQHVYGSQIIRNCAWWGAGFHIVRGAAASTAARVAHTPLDHSICYVPRLFL
jgi:hypothetical protein